MLIPAGLIITSSRLPIKDLYQSSLNIVTSPIPLTEEAKARFSNTSSCFHVYDGGNRVWLLPASRCITWLVSNS
jgi:hypothetical protein